MVLISFNCSPSKLLRQWTLRAQGVGTVRLVLELFWSVRATWALTTNEPESILFQTKCFLILKAIDLCCRLCTMWCDVRPIQLKAWVFFKTSYQALHSQWTGKRMGRWGRVYTGSAWDLFLLSAFSSLDNTQGGCSKIGAMKDLVLVLVILIHLLCTMHLSVHTISPNTRLFCSVIY